MKRIVVACITIFAFALSLSVAVLVRNEHRRQAKRMRYSVFEQLRALETFLRCDVHGQKDDSRKTELAMQGYGLPLTSRDGNIVTYAKTRQIGSKSYNLRVLLYKNPDSNVTEQYVCVLHVPKEKSLFQWRHFGTRLLLTSYALSEPFYVSEQNNIDELLRDFVIPAGLRTVPDPPPTK